MPAAATPIENISQFNPPATLSPGAAASRDPSTGSQPFAAALDTAATQQTPTGATSADPIAETALGETHLAPNESTESVSTEETRAKETSAALTVEQSSAELNPESAPTHIEGSNSPAPQNAPAPTAQESGEANTESGKGATPSDSPLKPQPEVVLELPQAPKPVAQASSFSENRLPSSTTNQAIISEPNAYTGEQANDASIQRPPQSAYNRSSTSANTTSERPPVSSNLKTVGEAPPSQPTPETGRHDPGVTQSFAEFSHGDSKNSDKNSANDNPTAHEDRNFSKRELPSAPPSEDAVKPITPRATPESVAPESASRIEPVRTDSNSAHIRVPHQQTSAVEQASTPAPPPSTTTGANTAQAAHTQLLTSGAATAASDAPEESISRELVARTATRGLAAVVRQRGGSLTLRLHPASLGSVRIEMSFDAGAVNAQLRATTAQAQQLLESNLSQLRTALESRGLVVDRLGVQLASGVSHSPANKGGGTLAEQHPENPHTPTSRHDAGDGRSRGSFDRREDPDAEPKDGRTNGAHQDDARLNEAERSFHESYMVRLSAIA